MSFSTLPDGRLVSYQLARRYYQKDPSGEIEDGLRAFMGEIKTKRDAYVKEIDRLSKDLFSGVPSAESAPAAAPAPTPAPAVGEKKGKWTKEEAIRELAEFGYSPKRSGTTKLIDGESLVRAANDGYADLVELLLAAGVPVDSPLGESKFTALFMSAQSGYLDIAAMLLKAGANPNVSDDNGDAPLIHVAQYCDEVELVRTFIKLGADVNAATRGDWTALKQAESEHCAAIAKELRKAGARK